MVREELIDSGERIRHWSDKGMKIQQQDGVTYRCFRSTGVPVYNNLADLVGIYVEIVA